MVRRLVRAVAGRARAVHRHPHAGAATIELVLSVPLLFLLLLGIVQFAVFEHAQHVAQAAASAGLAAERVQGGTTTAGRTQAAGILARTAGGILHETGITAVRGAAGASVRITGHVEQVIPGLNLTVTVTATGPIEAP